MLMAAALARRRSEWGPSTSDWSPVYACTVVIRPFSTPKASSRTFTMGTKQLVVHEAFDTTVWAAGSNSSSLTPTTNVASAPEHGAETSTRGAPPSRWRAAASRLVKMPVDSTTTSTPRSPQGRSSGLRTDRTLMASSPTRSTSPSTVTSAPRRPWTESQLSRWAMVSTDPRSLTATTSRPAPWTPGGPVEVPSDAAEAVDSYANAHAAEARPRRASTGGMFGARGRGRGGRRPGGCFGARGRGAAGTD